MQPTKRVNNVPEGLRDSPFGMVMPARSYSAGSSYRYRFNGKESDDETYGSGNIYDYGLRIYNPRLGKFLSVDPLTKSYPWYTPYQFAGNKPIWFVDIDGAEEGQPVILNQGQSAPMGFSMSLNLNLGTEKVQGGGLAALQAEINGDSPMSSTFFAASSVSVGTTQNGISEPGIYTVSTISYTQNFGANFSLGVSAEPRINIGYFARQSNISGSVFFFVRNMGSSNLNLQFSYANDVFTGKLGIGWNGEYSDWGPTDGGLTQHTSLALWSEDFSKGLALSVYSYTMHRKPFSEEQYVDGQRTGGMLYDNGLFDVNRYAGDYRTYWGLTGIWTGKNKTNTFSGTLGYQWDWSRVNFQGALHQWLGIGEFPGFNEHNYVFAQFNFTHAFVKKKKKT